MYYRIKNTLAGIAVASAILGLSWSAGRPPTEVGAPAGFEAVRMDAAALDAGIDPTQLARKRARGMRSQVSMPFFSFAPLLPRREG
jgi:hypothetical protein